MENNNRARKIVFITDKVYPFFIGGQEKRIYEYSRILAEDDWDVSVASMKWWEGDSEFEKDGVKYVAIARKFALYNKKGRRRIFANLYFGIQTFIFALKSDANIFDLEVFPYFPIIFTSLATLLRFNKPKIVGHWCECVGSEGWKRYSGVLWPLGLLLEKLARYSCDFYIAISVFTKRRLINYLAVKGEIIQVIAPFGVDLERINIIKTSEKKYDIIYFGRLIWHKHVDKILELGHKFYDQEKNTKILIIGDGPEKNNLIHLAERLGVSQYIDFIDFIDDYDELIRKIKSAKIMVSFSEREGFGISVLEANACGIPALVVNSPDNASTDLIENGVNGFICGTEGDFFEKTDYLLSAANGNILREMGEASVKCAEKFNKKRMNAMIHKIYLR